MKKKIVIFLFVCCFFPLFTSIILADDNLVLGGDSIGVEGDYSGVYVSGTYQFTIDDEVIKPEEFIHTHDLIITVNGQSVTDLASFKEAVSSFTNKKNEIPITVLRDSKKVDTTLITSSEGNQFGLYLKEKTLGIGTLTFYNPETNEYAALGHSISENDNDYMQNGKIYDASISNIKKAERNNPGEKNGNINYDNEIGDINKNINFGIYGNYYNELSEKQVLSSASVDEISTGKAVFYTTIEGNEIQSFDIEITSVNKDNIKDEKGIAFKVTDQKLIEKCGGIIHGMSGSPIVQNDKIIGAITHVKVDDPLSGYAIFITNMVEETKN